MHCKVSSVEDEQNGRIAIDYNLLREQVSHPVRTHETQSFPSILLSCLTLLSLCVLDPGDNNNVSAGFVALAAG